MTEAILEPDLPIIDPHHHLWLRPAALMASLPPPTHASTGHPARAPLPAWMSSWRNLNTGHNILGTVFVQCGAMYRAHGPDAFKPVGETEFVNGVAAVCASGVTGPIRACAGIVGHVDLTLGPVVDEVLEAHVRVGGGRSRASATAPPTMPIPMCWALWPVSRRPL